MVGQRKGAPSIVVAVEEGRPHTAKDSREPGAAANDSVTCPNCDCEFDERTGDVVHPGKPLADGSDGYEGQGADLEVSEHPVPGKMGAAADAARGEQAIGNLLANLRGRV